MFARSNGRRWARSLTGSLLPSLNYQQNQTRLPFSFFVGAHSFSNFHTWSGFPSSPVSFPLPHRIPNIILTHNPSQAYASPQHIRHSFRSQGKLSWISIHQSLCLSFISHYFHFQSRSHFQPRFLPINARDLTALGPYKLTSL